TEVRVRIVWGGPLTARPVWSQRTEDRPSRPVRQPLMIRDRRLTQTHLVSNEHAPLPVGAGDAVLCHLDPVRTQPQRGRLTRVTDLEIIGPEPVIGLMLIEP